MFNANSLNTYNYNDLTRWDISIQRVITSTVDAIYNKLGHNKIDIDFEIKKLPPHVAGSAFPLSNKIEISPEYLSEFEDQILGRTVIHEVVHLYVNTYYPHTKQHHGKEFRFLMDLLGADSSTKHTMVLKNKTWATRTKKRAVYVLEESRRIVKISMIYHNKVLRDTSYQYRLNGERIIFTGNIEII